MTASCWLTLWPMAAAIGGLGKFAMSMTGKDLDDLVDGSSSAASPGSQTAAGSSTGDTAAPAEGEELTGTNENQRLYFHTLGDDQSERPTGSSSGLIIPNGVSSPRSPMTVVIWSSKTGKAANRRHRSLSRICESPELRSSR